jgi:hypothetical protein
MRRFLASNSLAILSLIAIKNSQRESREGQGGPFSRIVILSRGPVVGSRRPYETMGEKEQYIQTANDAAKVHKTIFSFSPHTKYYEITLCIFCKLF